MSTHARNLELTYTEAFRPLEALEVLHLAEQATTAQSAGRVGTKK